MILMDTDVCIELLRGNKKVIEKRRRQNDSVAVSFVTGAELFYGAEKSTNREKNLLLVEQFLMTVETIHSDFEIMRKFGELKGLLSGQKQLIADADLFIASTCLVNCDRLITGNLGHYQRIEGLKLENWIR